VDELRIEDAARRAAGHASASPQAVLPAVRASGDEAFLCAFAAGDGLRWLVLAADGPLADARRVRDVAELVAMCEAAEEAAAGLAAAEAMPLLERAAALAADARDDQASLAARAAHEALAPLAAEIGTPAVRVAEPAYLDRMAAAANLVGDRFDLLKEAALAASGRLGGTPGEAGEALAEALWAAVRTVARDGAPDRFREVVEASMGSAAAFADDVVDNYLIELEER
jgi:hypothetical protein